jgi:hypothetical protein
MHLAGDKADTTSLNNFRSKAGLFLVFSGSVILIDLYWVHSGWLSLTLLPILGAIFLASSLFFHHHTVYLIPGCLVSGVGWGSFLAFAPFWSYTVFTRVGVFLMVFGLSWYLISLLTGLVGRKPAWWALIPGGVVAAAGAAFLFSAMRLFDFLLYVSTGLGMGFLAWGLTAHLIGLIIPGCLVITMGPATALAWTVPDLTNALGRTGAMLVGYALGWGLITVLSRRIKPGFVWWPLIPGGVMAMVGWGLYIAGNPGNAATFIGNTGSIGLILFGVYLLLIRRGIQH